MRMAKSSGIHGNAAATNSGKRPRRLEDRHPESAMSRTSAKGSPSTPFDAPWGDGTRLCLHSALRAPSHARSARAPPSRRLSASGRRCLVVRLRVGTAHLLHTSAAPLRPRSQERHRLQPTYSSASGHAPPTGRCSSVHTTRRQRHVRAPREHLSPRFARLIGFEPASQFAGMRQDLSRSSSCHSDHLKYLRRAGDMA